MEVDLCGHATLATAHVLWESGTRSPEEPLVFATASGPLTCTVDRDETIWMDFPALPSEEIEEPAGLTAALGATPVRVARNRHDHLVELADAGTVRALTPDLVALARIETRAIVVTAAADDGNEEGADFVSRNAWLRASDALSFAYPPGHGSGRSAHQMTARWHLRPVRHRPRLATYTVAAAPAPRLAERFIVCHASRSRGQIGG